MSTARDLIPIMCSQREQSAFLMEQYEEAFTILCAKKGLLTSEIETLKNRLSRILYDHLAAKVDILGKLSHRDFATALIEILEHKVAYKRHPLTHLPKVVSVLPVFL